MKCLYVLLRNLIDEYIGGVGQGGKWGLGIEKQGSFGSFSIRIPGSSKEKLIRIRSLVKIYVIQCMPQVAQRLISKSMLKGRMIIPLYLVHVGIQRYILEPGKIVP